MARHHVVAVGSEGVEIERRLGDPGCSLTLAGELGRAQQRLRRDAAPVRAFPADHAVLDEGNRLAGLQQGVQGNFPAGARADDDRVVPVRHAPLLAVDVGGCFRRSLQSRPVALIDISVALRPRMAVWDDAAIRVERTLAIAAGDVCNETELGLSVHTGTHVDAPLHFVDGAPSIDSLPPELFVGPAEVVDARSAEHRIDGALVAELVRPGVERVLFKTRSAALWDLNRSSPRSTSASTRPEPRRWSSAACASRASTT